MSFISKKENSYGVLVSRHRCDACGLVFTVTPAVSEGNEDYADCLAPECPSYNPHRDADVLFMTDKEIANSGNIVSIDMLRVRKNNE